MKKLLLAAVAGTALLSGIAHAGPTLSIKVFDGATLIYTSAPSTNGFVGVQNWSEGIFSSITVSANGIGLLPSPDLSSNTLDVASGGAGNLTVMVSQTGVTVPAPLNLLSTFTINNLTALNSSVMYANYISASNAAFALDTAIATATLDPTVKIAGPIMFGPTPTTFSETEVYTIHFGAAGGANLSSEIVAAPEPVSIGLLGVGLLGLGLVHRQKKNTVA